MEKKSVCNVEVLF